MLEELPSPAADDKAGEMPLKYINSEEAKLLTMKQQIERLDQINADLCRNHNTLLIQSADLERQLAQAIRERDEVRASWEKLKGNYDRVLERCVTAERSVNEDKSQLRYALTSAEFNREQWDASETRAEAAEAKLAALTLPADFDESALGKPYVLPEIIFPSELTPYNQGELRVEKKFVGQDVYWYMRAAWRYKNAAEYELSRSNAYHRRDLREIRAQLIRVCKAAEAQGRCDAALRNQVCNVVLDRILELEGR